MPAPLTAPDPARTNLRGILLMLGAMAGFAVEDALIKLAAGAMPPGQVMLTLGLAGALAFGLWARAEGAALWTPALLSRGLIARNLAEMVAGLGFITALTLIPLATASALLQATPLAVTAGAAVFLGEVVGWRRWLAVAAGFGGVLLIIRPGAAGFDANALWALLGVAGLAARDLITRRMPAALPTTVIGMTGNMAVALMGAGMLAVSGGAVLPGPAALAQLAGAVAIGVIAYWAIIEATRAGEVSVITPFRYSRLIFALALGAWLFGERPDALTLTGACIVIGAGLYTLYRERLRGLEAARRASSPEGDPP